MTEWSMWILKNVLGLFQPPILKASRVIKLINCVYNCSFTVIVPLTLAVTLAATLAVGLRFRPALRKI